MIEGLHKTNPVMILIYNNLILIAYIHVCIHFQL